MLRFPEIFFEFYPLNEHLLMFTSANINERSNTVSILLPVFFIVISATASALSGLALEGSYFERKK